MFHSYCQFGWLEKTGFKVDVKAPITCPRHCDQYQEFAMAGTAERTLTAGKSRDNYSSDDDKSLFSTSGRLLNAYPPNVGSRKLGGKKGANDTIGGGRHPTALTLSSSI